MDVERRFADLDEHLLIDAAKVDSRALSVLYRKHYAGIFSYVQRRIGSACVVDGERGEKRLLGVEGGEGGAQGFRGGRGIDPHAP